MREYSEDLHAVTAPFVEDHNVSRQSIPIHNRSLLSPLPLGDTSLNPPAMNQFRSHSQIFMKRSNVSLTIIFYLAMLVFFLELLVMLHKPHFHTLLAAIAVLAIFGLNYFDKGYIRVTLGILAISTIMDVFWVLFYTGVRNR